MRYVGGSSIREPCVALVHGFAPLELPGSYPCYIGTLADVHIRFRQAQYACILICYIYHDKSQYCSLTCCVMSAAVHRICRLLLL